MSFTLGSHVRANVARHQLRMIIEKAKGGGYGAASVDILLNAQNELASLGFDKGTHMIRYVFDNKQALVDHWKADAKRLRATAANSKPGKAKELLAEAYTTESLADMLESTFLRDTAAIQADPKI